MTTIEPSATMQLLAAFEASAKVAQVAEANLRRELAAQIAYSERQRINAFRRIRLIKTLADSTGAPSLDDDTRWQAQRYAVAEDVGWSTVSDNYAAILEQIRPLAAAVHGSLRAADASTSGIVLRELERFERWFEDEHGKSFYALYDQYVPEVPVVDF